MNFKVHLHDGETAFLSLHRISRDRFLCLAAKSGGKGKHIRNPPSGWEIRKDPKDDAFAGQPEHYHCTRKSDDFEMVITAEGGPSHDTKSGEKIPKKLGEHLINELGIPILKNSDGKHVVRLVFADPWGYYFSPSYADLLAQLWNLPSHRLGEATDDT